MGFPKLSPEAESLLREDALENMKRRELRSKPDFQKTVKAHRELKTEE
jgi:hypothetical protein